MIQRWCIHVAAALGAAFLLANPHSVVAACHKGCKDAVGVCRRTECAGLHGTTRRRCVDGCHARSTCTAPGAGIGTLAYVETECRSDRSGAQEMSSFAQRFMIRRGNCDPVSIKEVRQEPVPDPTGICRFLGTQRVGSNSVYFGVFQRIGVLRDGSGVVFEVTDEFRNLRLRPWPTLTLSPPERGIFFVRPDGSNLRRLGDASHAPTTREGGVFAGPGVIVESGFALSPGQSTIAFSDVGPGADGRPARQIFTMDLSSGDRLQVTRLTADQFPGAPSFIDDRTIAFDVADTALDPSDPTATQQSFSVRADGRGELHPLAGSLVAIEGATVVPDFDVTRGRRYAALVTFKGKASDLSPRYPDYFREVFLFQQGRALQLTNLRHFDTRLPLLSHGRVFFESHADPLGSNAGRICQLFSVDVLGGHLRQLTHFEDHRPRAGCFYLQVGGEPGSACTLTSRVWIDPVTGTVVFLANCDPLGTNPYGSQAFAMHRDGSRLRQLTALRGMRQLADGTVHVELVGPARGQ